MQSGLDKKIIKQAVQTLNSGGIIGFPTETYYGLGVDPYNHEALSKLFYLKGRERNKPILLLVNELKQLFELTEKIPDCYKPLVESFWPGPLTLVFEAKKTTSSLLTGGTGTVGVRISPNPIAQAIITQFNKPITATSANLSGEEPAKTNLEVIEYFGDTINYVVPGGETKAGLCSTVISQHRGQLQLIREGVISLKEIENAIEK